MKKMPCLALVVCAFLLNACQSRLVQPEEFSGSISDYQKLQPVKTVDGQTGLRWVNPDFKPGNYASIWPAQVAFFPEPEVSKQAPADTLERVRRYCDDRIRSSLSDQGILVDRSGAGVLHLKTAITGVKIATEPFKPWEIIPFKLVMAGAGAAIGFRNKDLDVFYEMVAQDSVTGETQFVVVRKLRGKDLSSQWDQMQVSDVQKVFDRFAEKGAAALADVLKEP